MIRAVATIAYIDGFNLYYGALKGTPYKWLDLESFVQRLLPKDDVVKIRYLTARITARAEDPQQAVRQETYLRALATCSLVELHFGHYVTRRVRMALADPPPRQGATHR
ncbi:MAG: hypothetical protein ACC652_14420 [Acidimicrobiales bacterium]